MTDSSVKGKAARSSWVPTKSPCATSGGKHGEIEPEDLSGNLIVQLSLVE
jgi:hypothetical protein